MNKNQWLAKLHELAFEDTRLDKIPFVCFEPLAEGIANIQAAEQKREVDASPDTCEHGFMRGNVSSANTASATSANR